MLVAFICAHFYSLKQASKPYISRDIDDFASGNFSYHSPLLEHSWKLLFKSKTGIIFTSDRMLRTHFLYVCMYVCMYVCLSHNQIIRLNEKVNLTENFSH